MRNLTVIPWLLAGLMLGCAPKAPPATPVTFDKLDAQEHNDQQLSLEGYPRLPSMGMVSDSRP